MRRQPLYRRRLAESLLDRAHRVGERRGLSAAKIEHPETCGAFESRLHTGNYVGHMRIVAPRRAVAEERERPPLGDRSNEPVDSQIGPLPRAVDREQPEACHGHAGGGNVRLAANLSVGLRCEVEHLPRAMPLQHSLDRPGVADVHFFQGEPGVCDGSGKVPCLQVPIVGGVKVVDTHHMSAPMEQRFHQVRADESGGSGDENLSGCHGRIRGWMQLNSPSRGWFVDIDHNRVGLYRFRSLRTVRQQSFVTSTTCEPPEPTILILIRMSCLLNLVSEASPQRKSLIMIMGVQRSGTTALFDILASAPGVSARQETAGDEIYDDYFLRPQPEIREILHAFPGTVLLKPVRESERRSPLQVAEEYRDYDLRIVWLYRDPVNVFHSYVRRGWFEASPAHAVWFAKEWSQRNAEAVDSAGPLGKRLLVVCYEDLTANRFFVTALAKLLGLQVGKGLERDSSGGRISLSQEIQSLIDDNTTITRGMLERRRSIRSRDNRTVLDEGFFDRLYGWFGSKPKSKRVPPPIKTILCTDEYDEVFRALDIGAVYRRWRESGPVTLIPNTGGFVAIGYEACRAIYAASVPFVKHRPLPWEEFGDSARHAAALETYFSKRRSELRSRIAGEVQAACMRLPEKVPCDLAMHLSALADRITAVWLGLTAADEKSCTLKLRRMTLPAETSVLAGEWESIRLAVEKTGTTFDLLREGLLRPEETLDFVRETCLPLQALPILVGNTLAILGGRPDALSRVRATPSLIRPAINESLRLTPLFVGMKRRLTRPVKVHGLALPSDSEVDLLVGGANRDPDAFPEPDTPCLDRRSPAPLLLESEGVPFTRLEDKRQPGCDHLVFDVATIVLHNLLAGPQLPRLDGIKEMGFLIRLDGSCIQKLREVRLAFDPASPV